MIQYRAKHPELYPRYANWQLIGANDWISEDFVRFDVKIDKTVYTKDTKAFRNHIDKNKMWEKLTV